MQFIHSTIFVFLYPCLLVLAVLGGAAIARYRYHKRNIVWKPMGLESSSISVFGLILSFTLGIANTHFKDLTENINTETDIAAQMRRKSLFMPVPVRTEVKQYLLDYTRINVTGSVDSWKEQKLLDSVSFVNNRFLDYLQKAWTDSTISKADLDELMVSYNNLCTYFYKNTFANEQGTPGIIMLILLVGSLLTGMLIGFVNSFAVGYKSILVPGIFVFLTSMSIIAILDIDNPKAGLIRPDMKNMQYFHESLLTSSRK